MVDSLINTRKKRTTISKEIISAYIIMLKNGSKVCDISKDLDISTKTVRRMKKRYEDGMYDNIDKLKTKHNRNYKKKINIKVCDDLIENAELTKNKQE